MARRPVQREDPPPVVDAPQDPPPTTGARSPKAGKNDEGAAYQEAGEPENGARTPRGKGGAAYQAEVAAVVAEVVEDPARGPKLVSSRYETAVGYCRELIIRDEMSPQAVREIAKRLGIHYESVRQAHYEAARGLRLDSGGILERQEASIAACERQRREALANVASSVKKRDEWRAREQRAVEDAEAAETPALRASLLRAAAEMGTACARYGMEAEKWQMSALAHQRHLDSVQCLVGPRELHVHGGGDGAPAALLESLGKALRTALTSAGRADAVVALDAALALLASSE